MVSGYIQRYVEFISQSRLTTMRKCEIQSLVVGQHCQSHEVASVSCLLGCMVWVLFPCVSHERLHACCGLAKAAALQTCDCASTMEMMVLLSHHQRPRQVLLVSTHSGICRAMSQEEKTDLSQFGPAQRQRVARQTSYSLHQVQSCQSRESV